MSCNICLEEYKSSAIRKKVTCPRCEYEACSRCVRRYILEGAEPKCPNCRASFTLGFMTANFPTSWRFGDLKVRRESVMLEVEESMLPAAQQIIEEKAEHEAREFQLEFDVAAIEAEITALSLNVDAINKEIGALREKQQALRQEFTWKKNVKSAKRTFHRKCANENCRGFLSSSWKCGLCGEKTCSKCMLPVEEEHQCKPEDVQTAALIKEECKPCPKCMVEIFKISGCDQMWCTSCRTAFSWKTGAIFGARDTIHNPHYYEWAAAAGPRAGEDREDCGEIMRFTSFCDAVERYSDWKQFRRASLVHRAVIHLARVIMPRWAPQPVDEATHLDLRLLYLQGKIGKDEWAKTLYRREKVNSKKRDTHEILDMVRTAAADVFNKVRNEKYGGKVTEAWLLELEGIRTYANEQFVQIGRHYNNKARYLNDDWALV